MATTQAKANPKKKNSGFQGVRDAIWIIIACFILAVCFFKFVLGNPDNFVGGDPANAVKDGSLLGTVYKGGVVVPVIITLLFTVIALSIERYFALRTAFGKAHSPSSSSQLSRLSTLAIWLRHSKSATSSRDVLLT